MASIRFADQLRTRKEPLESLLGLCRAFLIPKLNVAGGAPVVSVRWNGTLAVKVPVAFKFDARTVLLD